MKRFVWVVVIAATCTIVPLQAQGRIRNASTAAATWGVMALLTAGVKKACANFYEIKLINEKTARVNRSKTTALGRFKLQCGALLRPVARVASWLLAKSSHTLAPVACTTLTTAATPSEDLVQRKQQLIREQYWLGSGSVIGIYALIKLLS